VSPHPKNQLAAQVARFADAMRDRRFREVVLSGAMQ
jgi:vacuolar-type H+-ATPase subunit B/Vma2